MSRHYKITISFILCITFFWVIFNTLNSKPMTEDELLSINYGNNIYWHKTDKGIKRSSSEDIEYYDKENEVSIKGYTSKYSGVTMTIDPNGLMPIFLTVGDVPLESQWGVLPLTTSELHKSKYTLLTYTPYNNATGYCLRTDKECMEKYLKPNVNKLTKKDETVDFNTLKSEKIYKSKNFSIKKYLKSNNLYQPFIDGIKYTTGNVEDKSLKSFLKE